MVWANPSLLGMFSLPSPAHIPAMLVAAQRAHAAFGHALHSTLQTFLRGAHTGASLLASLDAGLVVAITPCDAAGRPPSRGPMQRAASSGPSAFPQAQQPGLYLQFKADVSVPLPLKYSLPPAAGGAAAEAAPRSFPTSAAMSMVLGGAAGAELAMQKTRNWHILHNVPSIVALFDLSGFILYANPAAAQYFGTSEGCHGAGEGAGGGGKDSMLSSYFRHCRGLLGEMLETVVMGDGWRGETAASQPAPAPAHCTHMQMLACMRPMRMCIMVLGLEGLPCHARA